MAEISGVHVKFTGDTSSLNSALDDAQGELKDTKDDADKTTGSLRNLAKGFAGAAVAAIGIAGIGKLFRNVAREAQTLETSMLKIGAVIKATGGTAGRTGDQLLSFARALALSTLESTEGILEAQQRLLTFRKISGDVFDRTIVASTDLAAAMGTSLSGSAVMLGRALEDPVTGLTALTRTGTVFTDKQKDMVKQLVETGRLQDAQRLILKELEAQYGGTAVAAASGYAGALDTLGQRQQEFLLAINDTLKVTDILSAAVTGLANVFDVLTKNIKRVVSYIAVAGLAAMFAFRGAIVGAAVSIGKLLIPSLVGLRVAIMRTGIGLLVVGAGELVYQFWRLTTAAGSIGEALGLLKDVAVEVFSRIGMGISAAGARAAEMFFNLKADAATGIGSAIDNMAQFGNATVNTFQGALNAIKEIWSRLPDVIGELVFSAANSMIDGIEAMLNGAIRRIDSFTSKIKDALAAVGIDTAFGGIGEISLGDIENPFAGASADAGTAAAEAFRRAFEDNPYVAPDHGLDAVASEASGKAGMFGQAATDMGDASFLPLQSIEKLRELFAQMREEGNTLSDILGMNGDGEGEGEDGEGGGGAFEQLDQELTAQEERIREHFDRIKAMTEGGLSDKLGAWGSYFGNLVSLTGSNNKKLLALSKAFASAQALMDAYGAYVKVLNDPVPQPWWVRLAAAANVFAAGIGAVRAIKSVGSSGGGGAAPSAGAMGGGVTSGQAASAVSNQVAISLTGGDMFSRGQVIELINSINDAVDDGARIRLV